MKATAAEEKTGNSSEQTTEAPDSSAKKNESSDEQQTVQPPSVEQVTDGSAAGDQQVNRQTDTLYLHTIIKISVSVGAEYDANQLYFYF